MLRRLILFSSSSLSSPSSSSSAAVSSLSTLNIANNGAGNTLYKMYYLARVSCSTNAVTNISINNECSGTESIEHSLEEQQQQEKPISPRKVFVKSRTLVLKKLPAISYKKYENHAPILYKWSQQVVNGKLTVDSLLATEEYHKVSNAICDTIRHSGSNLLNMLKSLIIMGLDPQTRLVQFLENELLVKLTNPNEPERLRLLVQTSHLYGNNFTQSDSVLRQKIRQTLQQQINKHLDTVDATLLDLISLIKISKNFSTETLIKIEDQVTRLLDTSSDSDITLENLCYLIVLLSRYNRRNKPLIRAVVAKLLRLRSEEVYTVPPHLINAISSLNRLNYPEVNLLEKCADILINLDFFENCNEGAKRDFIVAVSQFNFYYPKLIDYYLRKLMDKPHLFKRQDLITLTITMARLNVTNNDGVELIDILKEHVIPQCNDSKEFVSKTQWFNFVYSLVLLDAATPEMLRSVLSDKFVRQLEAEEMENYLERTKERMAHSDVSSDATTITTATATAVTSETEKQHTQYQQQQQQQTRSTGGGGDVQDIYQVMALRRKYLTLCGLLLTNASGIGSRDTGDSCSNTTMLEQIFANDPDERTRFEQFVRTLEFNTLKRSRDLQIFHDNIIRVLETIAPKDKYMRVDVKTKYGFFIDAELLVDQKCKPQLLETAADGPNTKVDGSSFSGQTIVESSATTTATSQEFKKVALMCIGFNDTLLDTSAQLIGPKEAEMRILRALGYTVVLVHQNVMPTGTTALNRIKFLQNLIASHISL